MSDAIRILHVLHGMNLAGTETLLMNLYRNIDREKIQFDFAVCVEEEGAYDKEILSLGGKIIPYPRYTGKNHFTYKKWWDDFFNSHDEYRIVHGHIGSTASIYLSIAKKHGRYTIAHSHNTHTGQLRLRDLLYKGYSFSTRYIADDFFACSKQALMDRYGKKVANDNNHAYVLNNAIDAKKFIYNEQIRTEIRKEYNLSDDLFVIGTVGRISYQKNPYEIVRIVEELSNRNKKFKFFWIGTGELEEEIKEEIVNRKLENYFIWAGTREDIYNVLQAIDVFVFPSLWEGLGIACVEAQAAGLPVLCSDTVPIEAKVTENCVFLPLNDTRRWCDEILKLEHYERKNCYKELVDAQYDIKKVTEWLEDFYCKRC